VHDKQYYFQDDTSMWLSIWIAEMLAEHYQKTVEPSDACSKLKVGVPDNGCVVSILDLKVAPFAQNKIDKLWSGQAPKDKPKLYLVHEPDPS
jgi:hypothetical protein